MVGLKTAVLAVIAGAAAAPTVTSVTKVEKRWADETELWNRIKQGREILGDWQNCTYMCDWMNYWDDSTPLSSISIPGTHDTATWNYTQATQNIYLNYTGTSIPPAYIYQCHDQSIIQQLNAGMRAFDLRIGGSPIDNTSIIFYHARAILSTTATFEDILYGFYKFLDDNPSETIMLSVKVDNTTWGSAPALQKTLYDTLFASPATSYFNQQNATLGTLGDARGKINLIRRFDWGQLPQTSDYQKRIGLAAGPAVFLDNEANFTIEYAPGKNLFVEDYYDIEGDPGADNKARWKFNATTKHLIYAQHAHLDSPFLTFSSASQDADVPPEYPKILALGNGSIPGVNQRLLPWLQARLGQRRGILLMDWYAQVPGLVEAVIGF